MDFAGVAVLFELFDGRLSVFLFVGENGDAAGVVLEEVCGYTEPNACRASCYDVCLCAQSEISRWVAAETLGGEGNPTLPKRSGMSLSGSNVLLLRKEDMLRAFAGEMLILEVIVRWSWMYLDRVQVVKRMDMDRLCQGAFVLTL